MKFELQEVDLVGVKTQKVTLLEHGGDCAAVELRSL